MKRKAFCRCITTTILLAGTVSPASISRAQDAISPSVPASLLVPDRFARAVKEQSTGPYYLMATVVNDMTGETRHACLDGVQLFQAVRTENHLGRGREDWGKAMRLVLDTPDHTYHFTNKDAWAQVQPGYLPHVLAAVEEQLGPLSTAELAERFNYAKTRGILKEDALPSIKESWNYGAAAAYVLTERGLLVGRADAGNTLYVITPQMLAEDDKLKKYYDERTRRNAANARTFASRLPGYPALAQRFRNTYAFLGENWPGFGLSVSLDAISPHLVDSFDWLNPVNEKTRKARYDWNQWLPLAAHVERLARQHPWLQEWKAAGPKRTIEAQMHGKNLHNELDDDAKKDIVPAWKDSGLQGKAYCELNLRWQEKGEPASATVYLPLPGSGEDRSLIVSSYRPVHATGTGTDLHWLDRFSFRAHTLAKVRQVIVVTPRGDWELLTLPTRRPVPTEK